MSETKSNTRNVVQRTALNHLAPSATPAAPVELDNILNALNSDVTSPLELKAATPASLVVSIGSITVTNAESGYVKTIPPILNLLPTFTGGTVTFPSATGGSATPSVGTPITITIPSSNFLKVGIYLDSTGNLVLVAGTAAATLAAATVPVQSAHTFGIGYVALQNIAGTIQNISSSSIYQFQGGINQNVALSSDKLSTFAATTSAELASVISDETGSGALVFGNSPDIDGGTASNTSRITVPKASSATLSALTRKQGTILFDTSLLKLLVDNGTTLDPVGSGVGGAGEISAISNGSASSDTTGWTNATRVTSGSPLDPITTTAFSIANTAGAESATSGGYASIATLPTSLRNRKLKVEFWFTTPATDVYRVSVYAGSTRLSLSTDSSSVTTLPANTTGKFTASFDSTSASAYSLNVTRTLGATGACIITGVVVGPGILVQGAAVGLHETTSSYTLGGSTTPPTPGASPTYYRETYRDGADAVIRWEYNQTGAGSAGSGTYRLPLPTGLNVDFTRVLRASTGGRGASLQSSGYMRANTADYFIQAAAINGNGSAIEIVIDDGTTTAQNWGSTTGSLATAGTTGMSITVRIPIAEWAGSGTVNLGAGAQVEYAYNGSTATATSDTTSFAAGPQGAAIGSITAVISRRIQFQTPVQVGDEVTLEVSDNRINWYQVGSVCFINNGGVIPLIIENATSYGLGIDHVSTTTADVVFGQYACMYGKTTVGGAGQAWSVAAGSGYWRVKKCTPSSPVGFGLAGTDGSSGLYKPGQAPGYLGTAAIPTGYIGEVLTSHSGGAAVYTASSTWENVTSKVLTAGIWKIRGTIYQSYNSASSATNIQVALSGYSGATTTDHLTACNGVFGVPTKSNSDDYSLEISDLYVRSDGTSLYIGTFTVTGQTIYLKSKITYSGTAPTRIGYIQAVRIA